MFCPHRRLFLSSTVVRCGNGVCVCGVGEVGACELQEDKKKAQLLDLRDLGEDKNVYRHSG